MGGLAQIDVEDWKKNTNYVGYSAQDQVVQWFWKAVETYDGEMRARLLQFVTGTSKVPMNGFSELQGSQGPRKFAINKYGEASSLPRAHTWYDIGHCISYLTKCCNQVWQIKPSPALRHSLSEGIHVAGWA